MSFGAARCTRWLGLLGVVPALASCSATTFDGRVFDAGDLSFRIGSVPPGFHRVDSDGALLAYRDDALPATLAISGRCGKDGDDVPLDALTHHLFLEFTDRQLETEETVTLDGREALHTELSAKLDGVAKHFSVFVFKKNGCVYDFVEITPPAAAPDARSNFVAFVEGFSTIKP